MVRLSERLEVIAGFIKTGDRVADIGTDHGYIPMYLRQSGISEYVVAGDVNPGPLEKMEENLKRHFGDCREGIMMRLGAGLSVIDVGEVDTVVIAGMGGLLIRKILEEDIDKALTLKRLILQPRNAPDRLREWLLKNGFRITGEKLARESRFVWEIICAEPVSKGYNAEIEYFGNAEKQYEVGMCLILNNDPLLTEFIDRKLAVERRIAVNAAHAEGDGGILSRKTAEKKIAMLEEIRQNGDR